MVAKKVKTEPKEDVKDSAKAEKYFCAVGKRKTAIATVRLYPNEKGKSFSVNGKKIEDYFPVGRLKDVAKASLLVSGQEGNFDVSVKVSGGGINAQAEAVRLGVARSLIKFDESLRKILRDNGFLTRDPRAVERKKAGLKKARRAPQWAKR